MLKWSILSVKFLFKYLLCCILRERFTWSQGKISTKLSLATVSTIPWLYWSIASNSGSPRLYEELKQSVHTTFVTARVSSGDKSTAELCRVVRISHIELASRQTRRNRRKMLSVITLHISQEYLPVLRMLCQGNHSFRIVLYLMIICFYLTYFLDRCSSLSKHAQGSVHNFSMKLPCGTIVSKCYVFPISC